MGVRIGEYSGDGDSLSDAIARLVDAIGVAQDDHAMDDAVDQLGSLYASLRAVAAGAVEAADNSWLGHLGKDRI